MAFPATSDTHPLRAWRLLQKPPLTQDCFANRIGASKTTISRIELRVREPSVAMIRKIVAATRGAVSAEKLVKQISIEHHHRDCIENSSISEA